MERFGDRYSSERRVLAHREQFVRGAVSTENCLNCGEVLTGQHCSHCGQRAKVRVLSLWGLTRDVLGDLLDWDSRVWRTLKPLAFKPGLLTQDFLRGRRANYTPPFRMYLVLSVAFFVLASLGNDPGAAFELDSNASGPNLQLRVGDGNAAAPDAAGKASAPAPPPAARTGDAPQLDPETRRLVEALVQRAPETDRARVRAELEAELGKLTPAQIAPVRRVLNDPCSEENSRIDIGPLGEKYGPRLRQACSRIAADTPSFGRALYENVPKMMFLFVPLIGVVLYVLYLGSGRYFVEHLLFVAHYHAFFFLGGLVILLLGWLAAAAADTGAAGVFTFAERAAIGAFVLYVPYYLYRALRRVYGQGRVVTLAKSSVLGIAYVFAMAFTAVGLLAYTALTM